MNSISIQYIVASFILLSGAALCQPQQIDKVDLYLERYLERTPVPGFSIVIVEDDDVLFQKGYGVERIGESKPMTANSILPIGALGRGFTAMAILQLVEQGKLSLDEPIITYIPWFQTVNKEFSDLITLRMCLSNSSGIPPQYESMPSLDHKASLEAFIRSINQHIIRRKPGSSHEFCDEGYSIAAYIIEQVAEMSYADYIRQYIMIPLGMSSSSAEYGTLDQVVYGHEMDLTACVPVGPSIPDPNFAASGAQYYSSVSDLSHYMIALLNDGSYRGKRIISPQSIQELFKPNTSFEGLGTMLGGNGIDIQYALGWMGMSIEDRDILIHTGGNGQVGSILGINREKNQAFAILFNADVNQFDRFEYPGMENTVNNVIHILNNEDTTDFGLVRSNLVTEEDYDLPVDLWDKYVGTYESFGKQNPLFKNRLITVDKVGDSNLQLTVTHQRDFKGRYRLDFTNETQATLRNISQPRNIQFSIYPDGYVGGLYMFGSEFKKRRPQEKDLYQQIDGPKGIGTFTLPKSLSVSWNDHIMTGLTEDGCTLELKIQALGTEKFDDLLSNISIDEIQSKGLENKITVKKGIWTEQSIFVEKRGELRQYIIALYQDPESLKEMTIIIEQPYGSFNEETLSIIQSLQRSIVL